MSQTHQSGESTHPQRNLPVQPPLIDPPRLGPEEYETVPAVPVRSPTPVQSEVASKDDAGSSFGGPADPVLKWTKRIAYFPFWMAARLLDFGSLCVLLALVAAVPVVQFASLGYLLLAAANLAEGKRWSSALPGLRLAGKFGTFALLTALLWLPVWFVTDLSYSAQLLQPGSGSAALWRVGAFVVTFLWITHVAWAAMRGGRWWHLLWAQPIRFALDIWRPSTWQRTSDRLYELVEHMQLPRLWWLGLRASFGAFLWIVLPASLMLVGLRNQELSVAGLVGFIGAAGMSFVVLYLPFIQIEFAKSGRFRDFLSIQKVRRRFGYRPWIHTLALLLLCVLCLPLYLLRIEATPAQLVWAPALVFVAFMLPAKLMLGAAMGWADRRTQGGKPPRRFYNKWPARIVGFLAAWIYVGFLYVAQVIATDVMIFQHAFLVPAPFF